MVLSHSLVFPILKPHELQPTRLLCPRYSPGKNTGVGCHCLLQDIFPTQELNMSLLHLLLWQEDSLPLSHLETPFFIYHFSSVVQVISDSLRPYGPCGSTPGFPVHHQLPELAQTHIHSVGDVIQPSHPLSSPSPPAFSLSQHWRLIQ